MVVCFALRQNIEVIPLDVTSSAKIYNTSAIADHNIKGDHTDILVKGKVSAYDIIDKYVTVLQLTLPRPSPTTGTHMLLPTYDTQNKDWKLCRVCFPISTTSSYLIYLPCSSFISKFTHYVLTQDDSFGFHKVCGFEAHVFVCNRGD